MDARTQTLPEKQDKTPAIELSVLPARPSAAPVSVLQDRKHISPVEIKTNPPSEKALSSIPLKHLNGFTEEKLVELEKELHLSRQELDKIAESYWKGLNYELILNVLAQSTNILYMFFRAIASRDGIKGLEALATSNPAISDALAFAIGASLAIPGTLVYLLSSSPKNDAVVAILRYAVREDLTTRVKKTVSAAKHAPGQALIDASKFLINNGILYSFYLTAGISEVIPILDYINNLPALGRNSIIAAIECCACRYSASYYTESYYKGLDYLCSNKGSWLYQDILKGEIAVPFQIILQALFSGAGLRIYPTYYALSLAATNALGAWIPAAIVAGSVGVVTIATTYRLTRDHYKLDDDTINEMLLQKFHREVKDPHSRVYALQRNYRVRSEMEFKEQEQKNIDEYLVEQRDMLRTHVRAHRSSSELAPNLPLVGFRSAAGYYFGSQYLAYLLFLTTSGASLPAVLCGLATAYLFGAPLFYAEKNRIEHKYMLELLKKMEGEETPEKEKQVSRGDTAIKAAAAAIVISDGISNLTMSVGLTDNKALIPPVAVGSAENSINKGLYNYPRVKETVGGYISLCRGTLFNPHQREVPMPDLQTKEEEDWNVVSADAPQAEDEEYVDVEPERGSVEMASVRRR